MRVRVKNVRENFYGFYGTKRRYPGEVFDLDDPKHFSKNWMEKVDDDKRKTLTVKGEGAE